MGKHPNCRLLKAEFDKKKWGKKKKKHQYHLQLNKLSEILKRKKEWGSNNLKSILRCSKEKIILFYLLAWIWDLFYIIGWERIMCQCYIICGGKKKYSECELGTSNNSNWLSKYLIYKWDNISTWVQIVDLFYQKENNVKNRKWKQTYTGEEIPPQENCSFLFQFRNNSLPEKDFSRNIIFFTNIKKKKKKRNCANLWPHLASHFHRRRRHHKNPIRWIFSTLLRRLYHMWTKGLWENDDSFFYLINAMKESSVLGWGKKEV